MNSDPKDLFALPFTIRLRIKGVRAAKAMNEDCWHAMGRLNRDYFMTHPPGAIVLRWYDGEKQEDGTFVFRLLFAERPEVYGKFDKLAPNSGVYLTCDFNALLGSLLK